MIVDREDFLLKPACFKILRAADNCVECMAGFFRRDILIHHLLAASGVNEVVEADTVDVFRFDEVKNSVEFLNVVVVDRKAKPDTLPDGNAVLDACHRLFIRAFNAAKLIVDILQSIERDADITDANVLNLLCNFARDQRSVRRKRRAHAFFLRICGERKKIRTDQRLTARKEQHWHMEIRKVIDELHSLFCRQLIVILFRIRSHIAVHTLQIACLRRIPDDDWPHTFRCTIFHRMCIFCVTQAVTKVFTRK